MKNSSDHLKEYKTLNVEIITTSGNTTAYQVKQTQGAEFGDEAETVRQRFERSLESINSTMEDVLHKHFRNERMVHFQQSDAHRSLEGDTYLRYDKEGGIRIWFGGDNGETCLLHTKSPEAVDKLITVIKFGS